VKCGVEMGSDAILFIPNFIKIDSAIQKLIQGIHGNTESMEIAKAYIHFTK
jgi:hypothetical protein